ncbi:TetR/AcrR family transcriptional regulator [Metabacillus hrfriensis]|uniref:TetR/AcrR family transcriptional regulator n=1 Tax=Metabacillus hrfriensis TaxID=3048891 RepID=A0ACD4R5P2_9BACI|nr:TetR/AcrR family transcriptional regulator [Metabacillus sp. CT-WN-B3]WHZ55764.1 TetR/AcrR family transcriptional regulator [Metabacillus sp. CT-WN-B3]
MKQFERRVRSEKALLEAASALIKEVGCAKTTLSEIMERTGLSKGAIYHYIKSKDELFAKVLEARIHETNEKFFEKMGKSKEDMTDPIDVLSESFEAINHPKDVVNQILLYFIGRNEQKKAKEALREFDQWMFEFSKLWIVSGQKNGVISEQIDANQTAELFVLMSSGFRMRNVHSGSKYEFNTCQFTAMMKDLFRKDPVLLK